PVMETRWAFHRLRSPWDELPHLDMLPIARRLWSKKHGRDPERAAWDAPEDSGCRLVQLERTLFEVERVGDVPGFEIPGRYFDFVRRGDWAVLEPVLHHNRLDLLSLAGVTARAARLLRTGVTACTRAEEAALLGREMHRRADASGAEACYRRGLDDLADGHPLRGDTLTGLARLLRSQRRYDEAAVCWTEVTGGRGVRAGLRLEATEALAVHFEHRRCDLERAHSYAERAKHADSARPEGGRTGAIRLDRRLDRLRRKLSGARSEGEAVGASPGPGLF
ncbi:MAG: ribonuclease H-like domain-containing protein, partial [Vicinamibacteraceae bacterium]